MPDVTPPFVSITIPSDGAHLTRAREPVKLAVADIGSPSGNSGIARVELYVDSVLHDIDDGTADLNVQGLVFRTKKYAKGPHRLQVLAFDNAGNMGTSAPITVTL